MLKTCPIKAGPPPFLVEIQTVEGNSEPCSEEGRLSIAEFEEEGGVLDGFEERESGCAASDWDASESGEWGRRGSKSQPKMSMIGPQFAAAAAVRFSAKNFDSSNRILSQSAAFFVTPNKHRRSGGRMKSRDGIRAAATKEQSSSGAVKQNAERQRYHPFEEIAELELLENGEPRLRPAATTRIIIEV
ncbi:hypothetical protein Pfo_027835 [Paulownia fortunei]|nr:hypothetical protein Pfo_027835 [Paulownia fortunei]